ncbi:MAG: T9SS type A sorting domain-containing protein [Bacteroidota bacterium]
MKKFTLFIAACILSAGLYAQQFSIKEVVTVPSNLNLLNIKTTDTLKAPVFYTGYPCADTMIFFNVGTGYLTGNGNVSGYTMNECSQAFDNSTAGTITGAVAIINLISGTSGPFTAKVYNVDGTFKPTTALGTSTPIDISTLTLGINIVPFNFPTTISVTGNFAVSVVYPTATGDTICVLSTRDSCVDYSKDGYAYLNLSTLGWMSYKSIMGMQVPPMGSFDLFIYAVKSSNAVIEENPLNATLNLYPNPADDNVTIACLNNMNRVKVMNCLGQTISDNVTNGFVYNMNTSQLDNGVYLVQIQTEKGLIFRKITINR